MSDTANPSAAASLRPPNLHEIPVDDLRTRKKLLIMVVAVGAMTGVLVGLTSGLSGRRFGRSTPVVTTGLMGGIVGLTPALLRRRRIRASRRRLRTELDAQPAMPFEDRLDQFRTQLTDGKLDLGDHKALKMLAADTGGGHVLVLHGRNKLPLLQPIETPFEPQLIDESDPTLHELRAGRLSESEQARLGIHTNLTDADRFKRYFFKRGGWILVLIFGFNAVMAAIDSWHRGIITWKLLLWCGFLCLPLMAYRRTKLFASVQWLAVPGGIIVRKPKGLRLFRRSESLLCLRGSRHLWVASVADGQNADTSIISDDEAAFLLDAWYSPLPTPPMEKLSDLRQAVQS